MRERMQAIIRRQSNDIRPSKSKWLSHAWSTATAALAAVAILVVGLTVATHTTGLPVVAEKDSNAATCLPFTPPTGLSEAFVTTSPDGQLKLFGYVSGLPKVYAQELYVVADADGKSPQVLYHVHDDNGINRDQIFLVHGGIIRLFGDGAERGDSP
ncbi:hypothetical protein [Alicyclobacillus macrosporangiidus]|uniref:hypothetical protein n=1 Tax=Alicyclobacillus macrosporangiidus TaxID=392015 RepID=UPI000942B072|nr:hypothetical protein [Alicyclobacillus macrosporangiidus]